jgi:hypothetical protein
LAGMMEMGFPAAGGGRQRGLGDFG